MSGKDAILLVEDDEAVGQKCVQVLQATFPNHDIRWEKTFVSGGQATRSTDIVAAVFDNHLPRSSEERDMRPWAGVLAGHFRREHKNEPLFAFTSENPSESDCRMLESANATILVSSDKEQMIPGLVEQLKQQLQHIPPRTGGEAARGFK